MSAVKAALGLIKHLAPALALALALSWPAWAGPEAGGCYTDRKWRRHCPETAGQAREGIKSAKARAKEKTLDTYKAMERAKARAKTGKGGDQ